MNSFGNRFRLTTFGESHGAAIGGVIDGCPAGLAIDTRFVDAELLRRRQGDIPSASTTARQEADAVEWLSGIYEGLTLGTPIAFCIRNCDCRPADYDQLRDCFRPGHADYTYWSKYRHRDPRGGGRSSGRETASRVVAGAVAKLWLRTRGVEIAASAAGHRVSCRIDGLPAGVGEPVFDRLGARLAYAMLSIPSAMAFAMGDRPEAFELPADQFPDPWVPGGEGPSLTASNHCGGVQGGISNGMPVQFHVGFHLPVTQPGGMMCRKADGTLVPTAPGGRHDANHITRLPVIVESMAALVAADYLVDE